MSRPNRYALGFILTTVAIDAIGIGIIFPVMPDLIGALTGRAIGGAALWGGVLATAHAAMQFLCGPVVGNLSDRFGRRPVMLATLAVMAVNYLVMALAPSVWLLLAGRLVAGMAAASHAVANACVADISTPATRGRNFGLVGACFGAGFVAGPLIGGLLAGFGVRAPFVAAAAMAAANLVFGALVLPETVTDAIRRPFAWAQANPLSSFRAIGHLPGLGRFLLLYLFFNIAMNAYPAVWSFYGKARFGWDAWMIGVSLAIFGATIALVQALGVGPAIARWGERRTALYGMTIDTLAFLGFGLVRSGLAGLILTPLSALGGIGGPALQAIMSNATPTDRQGELQGILASIAAVAMGLSPLIMTGIFSAFTRTGSAVQAPGAPFLLSALLMVVCVLLLVAGPRAARRASA